MNHRDELISAIASADIEAIRRIQLAAGTSGIVCEVNGLHYTSDHDSKVILLTDEQNQMLINPIRVTCSMDVLPYIFAV